MKYNTTSSELIKRQDTTEEEKMRIILGFHCLPKHSFRISTVQMVNVIIFFTKLCCIGPRTSRRPRANTADLGPVTGPIRNHLDKDNIIVL